MTEVHVAGRARDPVATISARALKPVTVRSLFRHLRITTCTGLCPYSEPVSNTHSLPKHKRGRHIYDVSHSIHDDLHGRYRGQPPHRDWFSCARGPRLNVNSDRANLAGITNLDIADASAAAVNGTPVTTLREGDEQIAVVARLRTDEIAGLDDLNNLYISSRTGKQKAPLRQVSTFDYNFRSEVIRRRNQARTITVSAAPQEGILSSEVMTAARPALNAIAASLPAGYKMEIGGEQEKQVDGFE
jgi:multidrug efflux pump subunit AcrB